jgi:hypothetical protein
VVAETNQPYYWQIMKKLVLGLTLAAFAAMPALAGEGKDCKDAKACTDAKVAKAAQCESACATACAKQAKLKKGFNPSAEKGAMQLVKR